MIQRIQSLYLLLVVVCYILLFFFPVATYSTMEASFRFSILQITNSNPAGTIPLIAVVIMLAVAVIITIFLYKKRTLQIKVTAIILLVHIALVAGLFYVADTLAKKFGAPAVYEAGAYIAIIPLVFLVLANRAIRKDEKLVKSTDRLR
jgi:hypothetical protein